MPYLIALLMAALVWISLRSQFASVTIHEYERGLRFVHGAVRGELETGRHWYLRGHTSVRTFDLRSTELQQALRAAVATSDVEALLANRTELGPGMLAHARPVAERLGLALERVEVRDLTLPGELKKLFAQVVKARQEGRAALERARGETAALRNLANAATLVEAKPQLLELRALHVASQ
jgi:regulator of protease activity HflC (stomatin/prohibitin superfamily)